MDLYGALLFSGLVPSHSLRLVAVWRCGVGEGSERARHRQDVSGQAFARRIVARHWVRTATPQQVQSGIFSFSRRPPARRLPPQCVGSCRFFCIIGSSEQKIVITSEFIGRVGPGSFMVVKGLSEFWSKEEAIYLDID